MNTKKIAYYAYLFIITLLVFKSMNMWIFWHLKFSFIYAVSVFISVIYYISARKSLNFSAKNMFIFLLYFIAAALCFKHEGFNSFFWAVILPAIPLIGVIFGLKHVARDLIHFVTRVLAVIMVFSLITFILFLLFRINPVGTLEPPISVYSRYSNFIFFVYNPFYDLRFSGPFLEPGHLGMIISFLLFANKFNVKRVEIIILIITLIITFSLAGYVLTLIAFVLYKALNVKQLLYNLLFILIVSTLFVNVVKEYSGGHNLVNELILERLYYDDDMGIAGNNRFTKNADDRFEYMVTSGKIWQGLTPRESLIESKKLDDGDLGGAGYKIFLISNGIVGTVAIFLFYLMTGLYSQNKVYAMLFLLVFVLAFLQRAYPLWEAWIVIYVCSVKINDQQQKRKIVKSSVLR